MQGSIWLHETAKKKDVLGSLTGSGKIRPVSRLFMDNVLHDPTFP